MSTTRSREVLRDCENLLAAIHADLSSELWRPRWAGLVALLRAVGHVLVDENPKSDSVGHGVVSAAKVALLQAPIFAEFIKKERDNLLKAYTIGVRVNTMMTPGGRPTCSRTSRARRVRASHAAASRKHGGPRAPPLAPLAGSRTTSAARPCATSSAQACRARWP